MIAHPISFFTSLRIASPSSNPNPLKEAIDYIFALSNELLNTNLNPRRFVIL